MAAHLSARPRHATLARWLRATGTTTLAFGCASALATEGGGNSYPVGVETHANGLMLPEGPHVFVYYAHYEASRFNDDHGDANPRFANFGLRSDVAAARLSFVWPGVHWLGASLETRVVQAVASVDLSLGVRRPAPLGVLDRSGARTGLCDTAFSPLILGWHGDTLHQTAGVDTHLKTGTYHAEDPVNTGRNYYQVAPFYALTWFPMPNVDVNAKLRYAVNDRNRATDYRSGDEATLEFSAGYRVNARVAAGVNGYLYRQTTDDRQGGAAVNGNGNRGRVDVIGPYVNLTLAPGWFLIAKLQSDFNARNRPQGTRLWLQTRVPF